MINFVILVFLVDVQSFIRLSTFKSEISEKSRMSNIETLTSEPVHYNITV